MRIINQWAYTCAHNLTRSMSEDHKKRSVYYYALQIIFGAIVKNVVLFSLALLFGVFIPVLVIAIGFSSLRMLAGGYHMDTQGKCLFITTSQFMLLALVTQYTIKYWSFLSLVALISIAFVSGLFILNKYAPKDTSNKPITDLKEIRKFRLFSILYFSILMLASSIFLVMNFKIITLSLCLCVLLELFMITPLGYAFYDSIDEKISLKNHIRK